MPAAASFIEGRTMAGGTAKWINSQKGYELVPPDDGSAAGFVLFQP
jgi:cold shock CspA family protein